MIEDPSRAGRTLARSRVRRCLRSQLAVVSLALVAVGLAAAVNTAATAAPLPPAAGEFVPVPAVELVDTAAGVGWTGQLAPDETRSVTATDLLNVPADDVQAVMVHITTSNGASPGVTRAGNLWAWPADQSRPAYAVVANAPAGSVADNTAIVQVATDGQISFYNGRAGTGVDVKADIEGYVTSSTSTATGAAFAPLTPSRVIDTLAGTGGWSTPLTSAAAHDFDVLGVGGIPTTGVSAVALNFGARGTSTDCWVQVQPGQTDLASTGYPRVDTYANYTAQQLAVVAPDASGNVTFTTNCSSADIYADVEGYYLVPTDRSSGDVYVPIKSPSRVIDTRHNLGITGKMTAGRVISGSHAVTVVGVAGVPSEADAVAVSVGAVNASTHGRDTLWTDGTPQPTGTSSVDFDSGVTESNLVFLQTGANGKIDIAAASTDRTASNDVYVDIQGYFYRPASGYAFDTPQYFPTVVGDTYYNTVGPSGEILATEDDSTGVDNSCPKVDGSIGSNIVIVAMRGADPSRLTVNSVNCMVGYGARAGGRHKGPDGCSWKTGGITRVGSVVYLAVARQQLKCSDGLQADGLQPSFNASIIKSTDGGTTWTNPWGTTSTDGAPPVWSPKLHRYQAMFPGQSFSAPFFIQYGPGNTQAVDGGDKYLYAVSTNGYTYNGSYLHLARVPLDSIQKATAWQYYHGSVGGQGREWTSSPLGATRVLQSAHGLSNPAIQYVPALKRYVLFTFAYTHWDGNFPDHSENPYTDLRFYTSPKPWGPWTKVFDHSGQRSLWCATAPCQLTEDPESTSLDVGTPDDWMGLYDPALVQKFVFSQPLANQAMFINGDWQLTTRFTGEALYRLHAVPMNLRTVLGM